MTTQQASGGFTGDLAEAYTPPTAVSTPAASPCCGTAAQAAAEGSCCGATAKAEAITSGTGCCG